MAHKGRIMTVLFCGFLAGLLVWHIALPDRVRSETENRTLAQRPSLSRETLLNGSFTADMETYFADQFPLRDDWTGLKARCELLLGKREFNGVYLCGDTLIAKVEEPEAARPLGRRPLRLCRKRLRPQGQKTLRKARGKQSPSRWDAFRRPGAAGDEDTER